MLFHRPSKKTILIALIVLLFCVLFVVGAYFLDRYLSDRPVYQKDVDTVTIGDAAYRHKNLTTVLMIGLDCDGKIEPNGANNNAVQNDVVMLLTIDPATKKSFVLQLNRDTILKIDELGLGGRRTGTVLTEQLALAHTYGDGGTVSDLNVCRAVSKFLYDVPIDNYITVSMAAIPVLNDAVGGVTVTMPDDYTVLDPIFVKDTTVTLQGDQALSFVRARMSVDDGTNVARMSRQRIYIDSFLSSLRNWKPSTGVMNDLYQSLTGPGYLVSDISIGSFQNLFEQFADTEFCGFITLKGESEVVDGFMQFKVDVNDLENVLKEHFLIKK